MEEAVGVAVVEALARVDALLADPGADEVELAQAFGDFGRLLQVHGMDSVAEACYRNAATLTPDDFDTTYLLAVVIQEQGELERALEVYERVFALRDDFVPAMLRRGQAYLVLGDLERARPLFEQALAYQEYAPAAHYGIGRVLAAEDAHEKAIGHFEAALAAQPDANRVHYALGMAYRKLGQRDEAARHLEAHGQRDVQFNDPIVGQLSQSVVGVGARLKAGFVAALQGRSDLAAQVHREAVEANPDDPEARISLAGALRATGDVEGALEQYREAMRLSPEDATIRYAIGTLLTAAGRFEEGIPFFEAAIELDPDHVSAFIAMARARLVTGDLEEALASYDAAMAIDPNNRMVLLGRSAVFDKLGRREEAVAVLLEIVETDPDDAEAHVNLASYLIEAGEPDEAMAILDEALESDPEPPTRALAFHNVAVIHLGRRDFARAEEALESALEADPSLVDTRMLLAGVEAQSGRFREAAEQYAVVVEADPNLLMARLGEATALVMVSDYALARSKLEQALEINPGEPVVSIALAKLLATCPDETVRDGRRALDLSMEAFRSNGSLENAEAVAMAYAEIGDFSEAVAWQTRLVAEADKLGHASLSRLFRDNLARYERREPCRAPWSQAVPAGS
jgi:tetratricopeptide (TPR) repeat protein